jgi:threonine dehydrogenase-like Zn-dependent dehydrogenase
MKYSQIIAPRQSELVEASTPEPGPGEVAIEVKVCGICASELHPWMDQQPHYPSRRGHEPAGIVRAVGAGVVRWKPGDRVTGLCAPAFSDVAIAREPDLLAIPEGIDFEHALGEPLACLVNAQRRTRVELADRVALIGLGFMGLGMLQLLRLQGARTIIAIDPREDARQKALELGADEVYHPNDVPKHYMVTRWEDWDKPGGVDVAIDATGTQPGLTLAGNMVRAHGLLSILGFHQGGSRAVDVEMWNWKAIDVVNAHVRRHADLMESMRIGLDLIAAGKFSFAPLISHRFGLDEVDQAFTALVEKPAGFLKAVVIP